MLTQKHIRELLHYSPHTGSLTWRVSRTNAIKVGQEAGCADKHYRVVYIKDKLYLAHRLIWLHVHGSFPPATIDHINGDGHDNRIDNLRAVSLAENNKNVRAGRRNKSGVIGVTWCGRYSKWYACIGVDGRTIALGRHNCLTAAAIARKAAEVRHKFHPNHGATHA